MEIGGGPNPSPTRAQAASLSAIRSDGGDDPPQARARFAWMKARRREGTRSARRG
jgi:hypothetical protein